MVQSRADVSPPFARDYILCFGREQQGVEGEREKGRAVKICHLFGAGTERWALCLPVQRQPWRGGEDICQSQGVNSEETARHLSGPIDFT